MSATVARTGRTGREFSTGLSVAVVHVDPVHVNHKNTMVRFDVRSVRIGQIGCGRHGRLKLAKALASVGNADLVSCADLDEGAALRTAREFGFARHY